MKTIIVSSYHGGISRNILQTKIIKILREKNTRVIIVCHDSQREYLQNLVGEDAEVISRDYSKRFIDSVIQIISISLVTNYNLFIRTLWAEHRYIKVGMMQTVYFLGHRIFFLKRLLRWVYRTFFSTNLFDDMFEKYRPDVVFATDIFNFDDSKFTAEAIKKGIYTIGMVRSWDNVTTRGVLLSVPNKLICWSEVIRDELMEHNRVKRKNIFVSGIPHHDRVLSPPSITREEFLKGLGLDPGKKTLMLAPGGRMQYRYDGEILKTLKRLKDRDAFAYPVQFIIREQPHDKMLLNGFESEDDIDFFIDTPGINLSGKKKQSEITKSDDDSLVNSIRHSDIVMTLLSSVALDATYYDRPVIIIGFDPVKGLDDTPRKFTRYKHIRKLFDSGLLTIARSEEEFIRQVNEYLKNPALNSDKRRKLSEKYAYKLDGKSSDRLAHYLVSHLDGVGRVR